MKIFNTTSVSQYTHILFFMSLVLGLEHTISQINPFTLYIITYKVTLQYYTHNIYFLNFVPKNLRIVLWEWGSIILFYSNLIYTLNRHVYHTPLHLIFYFLIYSNPNFYLASSHPVSSIDDVVSTFHYSAFLLK